MRSLLLIRSLLLVTLAVSSAAQASDERDKPFVRTVMLSERPDDDTHPIYVKGQVVTTLRFEQPVDPTRTKMVGWEGRLEPLAVVRNKVILEPIHDLNKDEGIPLVVTLADGSEIPLLVRPAGSKKDRAWTPIIDQQVDVFRERKSYPAMHAALVDALKEKEALAEENQRYRKEETSEDHALAALLASGSVAQTRFKIVDRFSGKDDDTEIDAKVFQGEGKVAVVFKVKNLDPEQSWSAQRVRLVTNDGGHERAVAVRATVREISPGGSGVLAIVADESAFLDEGVMTTLRLEVYRHDGLRQAYVQLDPALVAR